MNRLQQIHSIDEKRCLVEDGTITAKKTPTRDLEAIHWKF